MFLILLFFFCTLYLCNTFMRVSQILFVLLVLFSFKFFISFYFPGRIYSTFYNRHNAMYSNILARVNCSLSNYYYIHYHFPGGVFLDLTNIILVKKCFLKIFFFKEEFVINLLNRELYKYCFRIFYFLETSFVRYGCLCNVLCTL